MTTQILPADILKALWLVAIAMSAMAAGYLAGPSAPARRVSSNGLETLSRRFAFEVRSPAVPWVLCTIGLVANVAVTAATGAFGYVGSTVASLNMATGYQQYMALFAECGQLAVVAAALRAFRENLPGAWRSLTTILLIELARDLCSGGMQSVIVTVLAVAIPYSATRHRLPKAALGFSALAFLMLVIPFNTAYRDTDHGAVTLSASQSIVRAPGAVVKTMTVRDLATALPYSMGEMLQRLALISSPAIIVQRTPAQFAFAGDPAGIAEAPLLGVVPRAVWLSKPRDLSGYEFAQEYFGLSSSLDSWTAITLVGDLYQHGGWLPVVGGMFMQGCFMRLVDQTIDIRANAHGIFLVLLLFPGIVQGETSWLTTVSSIPETVAFFLLAVFLTFGLRRPIDAGVGRAWRSARWPSRRLTGRGSSAVGQRV